MMRLVVESYYILSVSRGVTQIIPTPPSVKYYLYPVFNFIFFMNALINPFIYSWHNKDFNMAYRNILGLKVQTKIVVKNVST